MIFNDPAHTQYDYWDLMLIKAHHFAKDFTVDGIPSWWDDNERVSFEVQRKISRSKAAVRRAEMKDTGKNKPEVPGRYYVPVPRAMDGGELPTFAEWVEDKRELSGA